ncbi:MAG: MerR family transcriptional regulator [Actinomycetota bacterium]
MSGDEDDTDAPPRRGGKSEAAFRTISEVADDLDVPQHVLRFWESKFPQVKPLKRGGGRRYYRPEDVALLKRIRDLLYSEGYTIKGVQKLLKDGGAGAKPASALRTEAEPTLPMDVTLPGLPTPGLPAVDDGETEEERDTLDFAIAERPDEVPQGPLSAALRHELEELLAELEQLRGLLQPRER